jgi:AcrR family transcriptional regulator
MSLAEVKPRRRRLTRAEQRAETRTRLLDSAVEVCARRGLHAASVEEIAERAGYSTGAIYSNFEGKDDLLLGVFEQRLEPHLQALASPLVEARAAAEQARASSAFIGRLLAEERPYLLLLCDFWSYAAREGRVRERFARVRRSRRTAIQAMIDERVERLDTPLVRSPAELAAGFVMLAVGVLFEGLADPELDAEGLYASMFTLLSEAAVARSQAPPQSP